MEEKDNLISLASVLYRNRKRIILLGAVTFVVAAVITLLMPNYYKSTTLFYPTSEDLMKPEKIFGGSSSDLRFYGTDVEMDRLLAIAESPQVLDRLIDKFNLAERYGIKEGSRQWRSRLRNRLLKHYEVRKTRFDGIELSVEDTDPEVAAAMATAAREIISEMATSVIRTAQKRMINALEDNIGEKEFLVNEIRDSLRIVRERYGIFNVESQAEQFSGLITKLETDLQKERVRFETLSSNPRIPRDTLAYLEANLLGMEQQYRFLTGEGATELTGLQRFNQGMGVVAMLENRFFRENNQLGFDRLRLKNTRAAYEAPYDAVFVIQEAVIPDEKSRPKRSLIVLGAVFGAVVFYSLGLLLMHSIDLSVIERIRKEPG